MKSVTLPSLANVDSDAAAPQAVEPDAVTRALALWQAFDPAGDRVAPYEAAFQRLAPVWTEACLRAQTDAAWWARWAPWGILRLGRVLVAGALLRAWRVDPDAAVARFVDETFAEVREFLTPAVAAKCGPAFFLGEALRVCGEGTRAEHAQLCDAVSKAFDARVAAHRGAVAEGPT